MRRDPGENARKLYQIAIGQDGYFTAAQSRQAGYAYSQQHFHLSRGNWLKVGRGLFRLRNFPPGERDDLVRLSLWSHNRKGAPQAVVSHETALAVHELSDVMPAQIHLTVPPVFRKRPPDNCVLHKAKLTPKDVESRMGYQVTIPLRTLLDVAGTALSQEHLNRAVQDALERGMTRRRLLRNAPCTPSTRQRLDRALAAVPQEGTEP